MLASPSRDGEGDHAKHGGGVIGARLVGSSENPLAPRRLPLHQPSAGPPPHLAMGGIGIAAGLVAADHT
jgi:hypothetical protein